MNLFRQIINENTTFDLIVTQSLAIPLGYGYRTWGIY